MGNYHTVGPNEALVVSSGCWRSGQKTCVVGGWAWAWWLISDIQRLPLEIMTVEPKCEDAETAEGVAVTVSGVAQVKVMTQNKLLASACEQLLGKSVMEIKSVILQNLEGHLCAILRTLSVEQIHQDRDRFAELVRQVAAPDVGHMGIEILSFTIKDVCDKVEHPISLGKTQTAAVAHIGVAGAERDGGIREAERKKEMMDVHCLADTKMADAKQELTMQNASFKPEDNTKKAEAQLVYDLKWAKEQQNNHVEETEIEVVQSKKQTEIEVKEAGCTDEELIATEKKCAEAEAYKILQLAEGQKVEKVLTAQAEAEKMRLKADAYQQDGDAAKTSPVQDKIGIKVAAPLSKTIEIVILSEEGGSDTGEVNRLVAELPVPVNGITGVDLTQIPLLQKMIGPQCQTAI